MRGRGRPGGAPAGFTLVELVVATVAAGALVTAAFALLAAHGRLERAARAAVAAAEVARVAGMVVPAEVRYATPADLPGVGADTLALRALRGVGIICAGGGTGVDVRYRGMRWPDAAKDSVVAAAPTGSPERALALESDRGAEGACAAHPGETVRRWALSDSAGAAGDLLLVFERGSYHLSNGALRYRRGAGGRQPLTEEFLAGGSFGLSGAPAALALALETRPDPGRPAARAVHRTLLWNWPAP